MEKKIFLEIKLFGFTTETNYLEVLLKRPDLTENQLKLNIYVFVLSLPYLLFSAKLII